MKNIGSRLSLFAALLIGFAAMPAAAQSTWSFGASGCGVTGSGTSTSAGCTTDNISATATAWSSNPSGSAFARASMSYYSGGGLGISSAGESGSPAHSIESQNADEAILLDFGGKNVSLTQLTVGWSYNDTDITVLRWAGAASGPVMSSILGTADLIASGWEAVQSSDIDGATTNNLTTFGNDTMTINTTATSSWWLVTAYFGATSGDLETGQSSSTTKVCTGGYRSNGICRSWSNQTVTINNYDYFKLKSVSASYTESGPGPGPSVPEPASLALAGLALAGLASQRRRRGQRSAQVVTH
jgi:hypothetical protein